MAILINMSFEFRFRLKEDGGGDKIAQIPICLSRKIQLNFFFQLNIFDNFIIQFCKSMLSNYIQF